MKTSKRAFLATIRRPKITIALFAVFFAFALALLLGLSILASVQAEQDNLRKTLCTSFSAKIDQHTYEAYSIPRDPPEKHKSPNVYIGDRIDIDLVKTISSTDGIARYDAEYPITFFWSEQIELIPGFYHNEWRIDWTDSDYQERFGDAWASKKKSDLAGKRLTEYHAHLNSELAEPFRTNAFELTQGRHITPEDRHAVILSETLASKNDLSIGDQFSIEYENDYLEGAFPEGVGYTCDLTVIGLFRVNAIQTVTSQTMESDIAENRIFIDANTADEYFRYTGEVLNFTNSTYFVEDPAELDTVMERAQTRKDVEWKYFTLSYDDTAYRAAAEPLQTMAKIAAVFVVVLVFVMLALLYFILQLSLHGRKQELKVYHRLGIPKTNVFSQLAIECVLIAILAFVPASLIGNASANAVGNTLLEAYQTEGREAWVPTTAEITAAEQSGSLQELREDAAVLHMNHTPEELHVSISLRLVCGVLSLMLVAVVLFLLLQVRQQPFFVLHS